MTDDLAPYFETRETRIGRLPVDARSKFEEAEKSATTTGQADFADRQFVSLWLSRRTGLPRKDIVANFDAIAGRYFGDGTTAAAAWDKIAANYKSAGAGAGESQPDQPQGGEASADAEYADTEGLPKVGAAALLENTAQSGRAAAGGFEGFAQRIPAGLYSQAAAVTGAPRLVDPMTIPEYVDLKRQNERILEPYSRAAVYDEAMSFGPVPTAEEEELIAKNEKRMAELARGLDNENREAVKQWAESPVSEVSEEYRRLAGFWYDLSAHAQDRWGVDPEFQKTTLGQFAASAGSVPATAALAVLGVGGAVAMEGAFFADVEQERAQAEGVAYDPDKAFGANLASALPQMALEKAFGVERLMNDVLGELPKMAGKVRFGDFAKTFVRRGLTAGAEEALTEPTQGFWNDYMASLTYDEQRETLTGDGAKRRLIESVSGFALGFVFGGGISAVQTVDQNRAVKAGAEYLTTKDGQVMTAADFRVLRTVKSDADISATAPDEETGRLLIAAANGDASAQQAYNSRVMATLFKPTDDIPVQGMALGMVNNVPVVKMADGVIVPLDLTNAEDRSFLDNFKREAVRVEALTQTVNFLRKGVEAGRDVQVSEEERTLADFIKEGHLDVTTAAQRMGIAEDVNGAQIPEGTNPADVRVLGTNLAEYRDGVFRDVSTIYQGGNALTAVEEVAEGYVKKRMAVGDLVEDDLTRWREKYENDTGDKTATTGRVSNIEWFSKRVVDYAVANRKLANMPKSWGAFLRTLGEHLKTVIRMSERMKKLLRGGKVEADFESALKGALGMIGPDEAMASIRKRSDEKAQEGNREAAPTMSDVDEEMMGDAQDTDTFPKIEGNEGDGFTVTAPDGREIGRAQEMEKAQDIALRWFDTQARAEERAVAAEDAGMADEHELQNVVRKLGGLVAPSKESVFSGELRAMAENLTTAQRLRLFRKNAKPLDTLREALVEEGFMFESVTDVLDALDKSTRGEPVFGNGGSSEQVTFSLGPEGAIGIVDSRGGVKTSPFKTEADIMAKNHAGVFGADARGADRFRYDSYTRSLIWTTEPSRESREAAVNYLTRRGAEIESEETADGTKMELTFATSGMPQNNGQALSAQAQRLRAKKLAATGQLIARINAGIPLPAKAKAVRASTQASLLSRLAAPINTRLREISPELAQRLRRFEFDLGQAIKRDFDTAEPFLRGIEAMSKGDAAILDLALKNGDTDNRDAILVKYNLTQEFAAVDAMITATGQRAEAAGYTIVKLDDYFPRKVNDVDGLMMHYYGKPQMGAVEKALHDAARAAADQGRALTIEERQEIVNTVLRGYKPPEYRPRHVKQRSTEVVDVDANRFYADSAFALVSYIEAMNTAIEKRRFFGKFAVPLPAAAPGVTSSRIALDASIGAYIEDLIAAGQITRAQQAEVTSVLEARFQQTASSEFIKAFKSLSYMATMGQITSAMTQVSDLAFSLYENGVFNTMVAAGEAVTRQSAVTREALGLDAIAEEFREVGKLHRILNGVFKGVGIHYLDSIGKETLINAKFRQMQREVQAGRLSAKTTRLLQTSFTPAEQSQVIADLRAGKQTADTLFTVYSVLADYQPINASEYPEYYLRHPNGRIFYMLKSFTLKQFDAFRRESISLIVKGSAKQKVTGFRNLIHLAGLLYIIGVPVDWLKDWIMGRDTQLGDVAVDNVFKLLGVNRYNLWRFRESGSLIEAALLWAAPPAPFIEGPARDIMSSAGKIAEGDDIEPGEFESWRMLPFVGAPIYWWFGGGATKTEKRKAKERKSSGRSRIRES